MFHSFHAAHASAERIAAIGGAIGPEHQRFNPAATHTYPGIAMPAAMTTAAACNHVWISCPNSSAPQSCWPAFFVRADGITTGRLRRDVPGCWSARSTPAGAYGSTEPWRERAFAGTFHSGTVINHPRSENRTSA